ncbi:MAG: CDP-alcohol phosphatidyltransferase family protein [Vicinamibacterales bacterium]
MFDDYLRRLKDRWLEPIARTLGPNVSPNLLTWIALLVGLACAGAALTGSLASALVLWLLNRLLDGLDGTQARVHARATAFGAYLDIVLDFAVYTAIPVALVRRDGTFEAAMALAWLLASFYVNAASWMYLAAILEQRRQGASTRGELTAVTMPRGVVAGTETVIAYTLFLLLPSRLILLFHAMALLVAVGVVQRLIWARRHL